MGDFATKRLQAIAACEKIINGIEDGEITISSALLQCMKVARLVNDVDAIEWLNYELGGYPRNDKGYLTTSAWNVAVQHGRSYVDKKDKKTYVFTDLVAELENIISNSKDALNNFSMQGFSVSGDMALLATSRMTENVNQATINLLSTAKTNEQRLSVLKAQFYGYAIKWQMDLQFGNNAKKIFEEYQEKVSLSFSKLSTATLQKLSAIEDMMEDRNPERYSQVLTSCRRLWEDTAKQLFDEVLPNYKEKLFKTKTGKEIDVSGDHYNNKLSAVIETLQGKAAKNTLVGSETIYLVDWMEQINNSQSSGVHSNVTREQAMQCIIHTYIALGDILNLKDDV
ncbi:MAG: hypothetical protein E7334_03770 [Clostridiales bacterium]|nr:hypothetical protein [Clostridiales bacterium]